MLTPTPRTKVEAEKFVFLACKIGFTHGLNLKEVMALLCDAHDAHLILERTSSSKEAP